MQVRLFDNTDVFPRQHALSLHVVNDLAGLVLSLVPHGGTGACATHIIHQMPIFRVIWADYVHTTNQTNAMDTSSGQYWAPLKNLPATTEYTQHKL